MVLVISSSSTEGTTKLSDFPKYYMDDDNLKTILCLLKILMNSWRIFTEVGCHRSYLNEIKINFRTNTKYRQDETTNGQTEPYKG